ncbi:MULTISPECIES: hypothetical protein [Zhenhengia]|uniref:hypothetical protein n=1 Tax=Zhenhengia TaxID=2944196 RepID=UPI001E10385F|nr:hypothetical protein [Zhenhengia yiwuensis]MBS5800758.1 hypothetical protein [Clostridiales bacterium]MBU3810302.1 hypothetical protein [Candidatus Niameybacter stercoravium]MDY3368603.1 hypothetical protein [Zhenhengia yiwuensis]
MKKAFLIASISLFSLFTLVGCGKSLSDREISRLYNTDNGPRYVVVIEVKQSHLSLDINDHIKDSMNKVEIAIPVDKQFYDDVEKGDKLNDDFRLGSLMTSGSVGTWDIKIKDKMILE